jgi:hypothetical protein
LWLFFGCGLIALFVLSDMAQNVNYGFLAAGTLVLMVGIGMLITRPAGPVQSTARFKLLKKVMEREEKGKEKEKERGKGK